MKNISILGSTGSIGVQTLDVVRISDEFKVVGLTANSNTELLLRRIEEFRPLKVAVMDEKKAEELKGIYKGRGPEILSGIEGLIEVAVMDECETVVVSVVGNIGIKPTF